MTIRLAPLAACVTAVGLAALTPLIAQADNAADTQAKQVSAAAGRLPITARASCSRDAKIELKLADDPRPHHGNRARITLADAPPRSSWRIQYPVSTSDTGSATGFRLRADDNGGWRFRQGASWDAEQVAVLAVSRAHQRCELEIEP